MFEIKDEDIELLIEKYKNRKTAKVPIYDLKDLVKYGLMFLYGDIHYRNGKVSPCHRPFSLYAEHRCNSEKIMLEPTVFPGPCKFVSVERTKKLDKTKDAVLSCWAGYNLAIITSSFDLHAYFKQELLFQKSFSDSCALAATANKIYVGFYSGDIAYFDPVAQTTVVEHCHSGTVTSLSMKNNSLLSSSMDGTVFYRRKIKVADCGILDVKYVRNNKFICSCEDNSIVVFDNESTRSYLGHQSEIKSLSYGKICISSSADGYFGLLFNEHAEAGDGQFSFEMKDMGCSMHRQLSADRVLGYGLNKMVLLDLNKMEVSATHPETTFSVDVQDNVYSYATGNVINFCDFRSSEKLRVDMHRSVVDLSYSPSGDMLLVSTIDSPYILDLRYL